MQLDPNGHTAKMFAEITSNPEQLGGFRYSQLGEVKRTRSAYESTERLLAAQRKRERKAKRVE